VNRDDWPAFLLAAAILLLALFFCAITSPYWVGWPHAPVFQNETQIVTNWVLV